MAGDGEAQFTASVEGVANDGAMDEGQVQTNLVGTARANAHAYKGNAIERFHVYDGCIGRSCHARPTSY